ncbi:hypothetical protein EB118_03555 [bacterium]|nr:hypothetical protein [bacterium]NDC94056.1 hypothetical protein [bacterium]NDD82742.1 hypothetical protein [bacterium]NDG29162.1 hypothetical protein [bacterium]
MKLAKEIFLGSLLALLTVSELKKLIQQAALRHVEFIAVDIKHDIHTVLGKNADHILGSFIPSKKDDKQAHSTSDEIVKLSLAVFVCALFLSADELFQTIAIALSVLLFVTIVSKNILLTDPNVVKRTILQRVYFDLKGERDQADILLRQLPKLNTSITLG